MSQNVNVLLQLGPVIPPPFEKNQEKHNLQKCLPRNYDFLFTNEMKN